MAELVSLPGIKNKKFVAGLAWRHAEAKPSSKELRDIATTEGRWGMVRKSLAGHYQIGSCEYVEGVKTPKGVRPLAALVADHHRDPWMGLFPLDNGRYWYIAVRDGGEVIPGGDRIGTFDEVMAVRDEHAATMNQWNEVNGTLEDLVEMVRATPEQPGLRDLRTPEWLPWAYLCGAVTIVAAAGGGWLYIENQEQERARAAMQARARAQKAAQQRAADAEARILPWTREPMVDEVLAACHSAWAKQDLSIKGWALTAWHCVVAKDSILINTDWSGATGALAQDAPGRLGAMGNTSRDSQRIPVTYRAPSPQALVDETAWRAFWTVSQRNGLISKLEAPVKSQESPPATSIEANVQSLWSEKHVKIPMDMPPWTLGLGNQLSGIPGLRVRSIDLVLPKAIWALDGALYSMHGASSQIAQRQSASLGVTTATNQKVAK